MDIICSSPNLEVSSLAKRTAVPAWFHPGSFSEICISHPDKTLEGCHRLHSQNNSTLSGASKRVDVSLISEKSGK